METLLKVITENWQNKHGYRLKDSELKEVLERLEKLIHNLNRQDWNGEPILMNNSAYDQMQLLKAVGGLNQFFFLPNSEEIFNAIEKSYSINYSTMFNCHLFKHGFITTGN